MLLLVGTKDGVALPPPPNTSILDPVIFELTVMVLLPLWKDSRINSGVLLVRRPGRAVVPMK